MNLVLLTHPAFQGSQSMPRYANWLANGMKARGHSVELWTPEPILYNILNLKSLKKWAGYVDQYVFFPIKIKNKIKRCKEDTIFVFTDQALGPWVPLVTDRHHIIHCHDFLALRSANNEIPENRTKWSGRIYQNFIKRGFSKGKYFISISQKTRKDLHQFIYKSPVCSEVVYNGLNRQFLPAENLSNLRSLLSIELELSMQNGYLLHVGGNQWYKNRVGVLDIYREWRKLNTSTKLPLLMIGPKPSSQLLAAHDKHEYRDDIHLLSDLEDTIVQKAYQAATVFLFPSLEEGFGWPIAEAMACGTIVITTKEAPMTEVAADAAVFIERCPFEKNKREIWAQESAKVLENVMSLESSQKQNLISKGLVNARRFDSEMAINKIESIYKSILEIKS